MAGLQKSPTLRVSKPPTIPITSQPLPTSTATNFPKLSPSLQPTNVVIGQLCSPLKDHSLDELSEIISDPYHPPPMGSDERHQGVDFSYYRRGERMSIEGVEVQAVLPGRVAAAVADSFPFGNMIIVETSGENLPLLVRQHFRILKGESLYVLYAHLQEAPQVALGDQISACQILGGVGKTGNAGVAHLHLEMRHGLSRVQFPVMAYYLAKNTPEERQNYLRWATSGDFLHFDPMEFLLMDWPQSSLRPDHKGLN